MEVGVTITVPFEVYSIYAQSAANLKDHTVQQVMASVLCAYAQCVSEGLGAERMVEGDLLQS